MWATWVFTVVSLTKGLGDLGVRVPLGDEAQHLALAHGQLPELGRGPARRCRGPADELLDHASRDRGRGARRPARRPDRLDELLRAVSP